MQNKTSIFALLFASFHIRVGFEIVFCILTEISTIKQISFYAVKLNGYLIFLRKK